LPPCSYLRGGEGAGIIGQPAPEDHGGLPVKVHAGVEVLGLQLVFCMEK